MPELRELLRGVLGRGKESQQDPSQSVVNSGDYLKGYGYYKEEYAKEKVKRRTRKEKKRFHYRLTTW